MSAYIATMKEHFGGKKSGEDEDEGEAPEVPPVGFVPDLLEEAQVY